MEKYNNWKLKFYTIWAGQAVSLITSAILQMAIIFYLTEKTGSAIVLSMASLVGFLPYAVFGPAIGVLVDRHDRKKIMIGADLIIAAAGAVLAIVALYMELPIWMVMVVLFIRSIGTAFSHPGSQCGYATLVPEGAAYEMCRLSQSLQSITIMLVSCRRLLLPSMRSPLSLGDRFDEISNAIKDYLPSISFNHYGILGCIFPASNLVDRVYLLLILPFL